ncbi:Zinc finger protein 36, C3H1 type-like 1 [Symbiodinium microadriaticum]|uniref:Zinc finger protein 36, C3H1 type-like 1 n=1 Tax=Symbiodinium microadriaticum TaxID=2951 RepID=A0A1Q9EE82_SYMMI|nr:Zinc finger protein 36, C3H1 type-like 1 [Symbiodinium microadriaticum]CAE7204622.1 ZFP36L1 [Symbiodinium sp. KB8]CAE7806543.1 ZFP36L1 [Symbiodinium microadriaticum]
MPRDQTGEARAALKFTKICQYWQKKGRCHLGDTCTYAHSWSDLREQPNLAATALCTKFKRKGYCAKGAACRFAHGQSELRRLPDTREISHVGLQKEETKPSPVLWHHETRAQPIVSARFASSPVLAAIQLDTARDTHAPALPQNSLDFGSSVAPSPVGLDTELVGQNEFLIGQALMRDLMRDGPDQSSAPRNGPSVPRAGVPVAPRCQEMAHPRVVSYVGQPFAPI